jgi:hypothetical protein
MHRGAPRAGRGHVRRGAPSRRQRAAFSVRSESDTPITVGLRADRARPRRPGPWPAAGPARRPAIVLFNGKPQHPKRTVILRAGDVLTLRTPGGGGLRRPGHAVRRRRGTRPDLRAGDGAMITIIRGAHAARRHGRGPRRGATLVIDAPASPRWSATGLARARGSDGSSTSKAGPCCPGSSTATCISRWTPAPSPLVTLAAEPPQETGRAAARRAAGHPPARHHHRARLRGERPRRDPLRAAIAAGQAEGPRIRPAARPSACAGATPRCCAIPWRRRPTRRAAARRQLDGGARLHQEDGHGWLRQGRREAGSLRADGPSTSAPAAEVAHAAQA